MSETQALASETDANGGNGIRPGSKNTLKDLIPTALKILEDGQWHHFAEFVRGIGDIIQHERAVRFYQGQGGGAVAASRPGGDGRDLDERVRQGRRRAAYLCVEKMTHAGSIECNDKMLAPDHREYRLAPRDRKRGKAETTMKPAKPVIDASVKPVAKPVIDIIASGKGRAMNDAQGLVAMIDDVCSTYGQVFPKPRDSGDVHFHLRALRRIFICEAAVRQAVESASKPEKNEKE